MSTAEKLTDINRLNDIERRMTDCMVTYKENVTEDMPWLIEQVRQRDTAIEAVLELTYASDDGSEWEHTHGRHDGEPGCPACWAVDIRRAIPEALT